MTSMAPRIELVFKVNSKQSKITAPRAVFKEVEKSKGPEGYMKISYNPFIGIDISPLFFIISKRLVMFIPCTFNLPIDLTKFP
jgi:hypothetical protein